MLVAPLEQVAHSPEDRALAARAAREIEAVAAAPAADAVTLARASYLAGNTWRIAEEDEAARKAYVRARSAGDPDYAAKALEKQAELAFRRLALDEAGKLLRECASQHARTASGRRAGRALSRLAVVGKPAPDFETELWAKGPPVGRDDLLGKVTLVFAFAVWCPHCKRELPHAADLLDRYRGRGLQVVGLTDNTRTQKTADVFPFVEDARYRMSYPVAVDLEGRTTTALSLSGLPSAALPSAALIDRSGTVRWVGHPNYLTEETIERLLGEEAPSG
jgi:peroxiredoxin